MQAVREAEMSNVTHIGHRHASISEVLEDLNEMHAQGKITQIHVVFRDEKNVNWLSSVGDWGGLCMAAIMMQDKAAKQGSEE